MDIMDKMDKYGEVFTPSFLVEEMLDSIPDVFWEDSSIRIIDNSCGNGVFLEGVKKRLLKHHSLEHILGSMIFGLDIQEENVEKVRKLGYKNIEVGDALDFGYWGMKFDLVVGNPPYNKSKNGKKGNVCNPLWVSFVEKGIEILVNGGYLLYVHPPLYRKVGHKLWGLMKGGWFRRIHMLSMALSSDIFCCKTKVDWYLWKKAEIGFSIIKAEDGKEWRGVLDSRDFLPNFDIDRVYEVFSGKREVLYDCKYHHYTHKEYMSGDKDIGHRYPCVYLINKKGIEYYWSSRNDLGHFGVSKVVVSMGTGMAVLDYGGKYGMCEISFGLPIKSLTEGERLVEMINGVEFQRILKACKWKTVQIDYKLFRYLKEV